MVEGKVTIVTGGASGLGAAPVRLLAAQDDDPGPGLAGGDRRARRVPVSDASSLLTAQVLAGDGGQTQRLPTFGTPAQVSAR